jgi:hypothetical protein
MLIIIAFPHQELIILFEISLEDFLFEVNLLMPFVSLLTTKEIQWELEPQIIYMLLSKRDEVILSNGYPTDDVNKGDLLARSVRMHLNFHVSFEVPSEDIVLQGLGLSEDKLHDVGGGCS